MEIVYKEIGELKGYDNNARTHSAEQIAQIVESIKNFGFNDPIEVDENNVILSGHGRLAAAKELKLPLVPTICHKHLGDPQKIAYILAANKIAENAGWDHTLLKEEFSELLEHSFDIELAGFSEDEISDILKDNIDLDDSADDNLPELSEKAICIKDEIWQLDKHWLICGDVTDYKNVQHVNHRMGIKVRLVFTDPPYDFDSYKLASLANQIRSDHFVIIATLKQLLSLVADPILDFHFDFVLDAKVPKSFMTEKMPYYVHQNGAYFTRKGIPTIFNNHGAKGVRGENNYWATIIESPRSTRDEHGHAKSLKGMVEVMCGFEIPPEEYVFDPFGGSGTILLACEKLNRNCVIMEISEKYCDVIIKRWQEATGKKAVSLTTGQFFNA